jgi:WD40 repeat protein
LVWLQRSGRIGILAVCFSDGTLEIHSIPFPSTGASTALVICEPWFSFAEPRFLACAIEWDVRTQGVRLAAGCSDGAIAVWDISALAFNHQSATNVASNFNIPSVVFRGEVVDVAVSALSFAPHNGNLLLVCSRDGKVSVWDLRDEFEPVSSFTAQTDGIFSASWISNTNCALIATAKGLRISDLIECRSQIFRIENDVVGDSCVCTTVECHDRPNGIRFISGYESGVALIGSLDIDSEKVSFLSKRHFSIH